MKIKTFDNTMIHTKKLNIANDLWEKNFRPYKKDEY